MNPIFAVLVVLVVFLLGLALYYEVKLVVGLNELGKDLRVLIEMKRKDLLAKEDMEE